MNLIMRGILPDNITTRNGDTLEDDWPYFDESDPLATYEPLYVDAVVSNPPYFVDSLKGPDESRNTARHTCSLSFKALIQQFCNITSEHGRLALVLPSDALDEIKLLIKEFDLYMSKLVFVYTKKNKPAKRILIEISKKQIALEKSELFFHDSGAYSQDFINLTKDFYLKM